MNLDVLLLRSVMRPLLERNYSTGEGEGDGGFHADKAHPNCAGHALMGRAVASFLIERLRRERARALVNESGADHDHDAVVADVPAPWGSVRTVLPSDATADMLLLHHEEVCYTSAADMPVSFPVSSGQLGASDGHHGTWRLVNDGLAAWTTLVSRSSAMNLTSRWCMARRWVTGQPPSTARMRAGSTPTALTSSPSGRLRHM